MGCATGPTLNQDTARLSGAQLYQQLCVSCHGPAGRGDGPRATSGEIRSSDLTRLAQREGGEFPAADVYRAIDGRWDRRAHGTRDMPVWGRQLFDNAVPDDPAARARVDSAIERLVNHLRSIQEN